MSGRNFNDILNFDEPLDVGLLEEINQTLANPRDVSQIGRAEDVLIQFRDHPLAYSRCDAVLQQSACPVTLFYALGVMERAIASRWHQFPPEEQLGIRNFLVSVLVQWCENVEHMRANHMTITKLNLAIVAIAKRDWPHRWPGFVQEVCKNSDFSVGMMENSLNLLALLGEEVFVFGEKTMTSRWIERKKEALADDIGSVFDLCRRAFGVEDFAIQIAAMNTLEKYIAWVPLSQVFEPQLFDFWVNWALPNAELRPAALACLIEVASVKIPLSLVQRETYYAFLREMFETALGVIIDFLPTNSNSIEERITYCFENGNSDDERVIDLFGQFIAAFLKNHITILRDNGNVVNVAHRCMLGVTNVDNKEVFKMCADYWWFIGDALVRNTTIGIRSSGDGSNGSQQHPQNGANGSSASGARQSGRPTASMTFRPFQRVTGNAQRGDEVSAPGPMAAAAPVGGPSVFTPIYEALEPLLNDVRLSLIRRMAKPEEVVIVEDENGELQHITMTDVETIHLYNVMRETLIFLTSLNHQDMRGIFVMLVKRQQDRSDWSWQKLNSLCWAVGSIGGTMPYDDEKALFADVVKVLLDMCANIRGSDNKAVIASNIMYVTGQYPRFLEHHERFLVTVIHKLFEFMHESFPGVMDMAVDTFLKIVKSVPQSLRACAVDIITDHHKITNKLNQRQQCVFFEAAGVLISILNDPGAFNVLLVDANNVMKELAMVVASTGAVGMANEETLSSLIHALRLNVAVAKTSGTIYGEQFRYIFEDLRAFYICLGELMIGEIDANGEAVCQLQHVKLMRTAKREILQLITRFIENTAELDFVAEECMPIIFEYVLTDYSAAVPAAKEPAALALVTTCVTKLQDRIAHNAMDIIGAVFDTTVALFTENTQNFPEHRVNLFKLLQALNDNCFPAFLDCCANKPDIIEGLMWAIRHSETNVMMTGLTILLSFVDLVTNFSDAATSFFEAYMTTLVSAVLQAMMDTMHAPGFDLQCAILAKLMFLSRDKCGSCTAMQPPAVAQAISNVLGEFPTLTESQIQIFTHTAFGRCTDLPAFRTNMADLLIEVQVWGAQEEGKDAAAAAREEREALLPGLVKTAPRATYLAMQDSMCSSMEV